MDRLPDITSEYTSEEEKDEDVVVSTEDTDIFVKPQDVDVSDDEDVPITDTSPPVISKSEPPPYDCVCGKRLLRAYPYVIQTHLNSKIHQKNMNKKQHSPAEVVTKTKEEPTDEYDKFMLYMKKYEQQRKEQEQEEKERERMYFEKFKKMEQAKVEPQILTTPITNFGEYSNYF